MSMEKMTILLLLNEILISKCKVSTSHLPTKNTQMTEKRKTNVQNIDVYPDVHGNATGYRKQLQSSIVLACGPRLG